MSREDRRAFAARLAAASIPALLASPPGLAAPLAIHAVDGSGHPLADAVLVVMVKDARTTAPPGTTVRIGQRDRQFVPQVSVVQTGTAVMFPNLDTVRHHVYSFSAARTFDLKLYAGTPAAPVVFDRAGIAVLGCNIHDRMKAWVHVVDSPYFATTDAAGDAVLEVPAGDHRLRTWHASLGDEATPGEEALRVAAGGLRTTVRIAGAAAPTSSPLAAAPGAAPRE